MFFKLAKQYYIIVCAYTESCHCPNIQMVFRVLYIILQYV